MLKVWVPEDRAALAGELALLSLEATAIVSFVLTIFQLASTALTVTLKGLAAVRAVGEPVLPGAVPGAAVSPGTSSWSLVKAPALTVTFALVLAVRAEAASVAVTVRVPAVLNVKLESVAVPA